MRIIQSNNPRPLNVLAVGPNGLVAAASDAFGVAGGVEVWDTTGKRVFFHHFMREMLSIAFHPDGVHLLYSTSDDCVTIAEIATEQAQIGLETSLAQPEFALSPDGKQLLITSSNGREGAIESWALLDWKFKQLWSEGPNDLRWRSAPTFAPNQSQIALFETRSTTRDLADIQIRDAQSGAKIRSIPHDPASPAWELAFTVDSSKLLVRTDSRSVQIFDAATGAPAGELVHPGRPYVTGIAVHPRGPVACARTNGTVTFWNADTREQLRTLDWKAGKLVSVAFSSDGVLGAAGTEDGKVVVWDVDL